MVAQYGGANMENGLPDNYVIIVQYMYEVTSGPVTSGPVTSGPVTSGPHHFRSRDFRSTSLPVP